MIQYAGITIGPIFDTISRATVPAALWFSSILFSDLTRRLCKGITEALPDARIVSPWYDPASAAENDGVGVYHDRILFAVERDSEELAETLERVIARARADTAGQFPADYDRETLDRFLDSYLQIHYVLLPKEQTDKANIIQALTPYLNAAELMKSFPSGSEHDPFARLFANDEARAREEQSRNAAIKGLPLFPRVNKHYLQGPRGNIRGITEIAANTHDKSMKHAHYFAVVNADGDGMGAFLEKLDDADVATFSAACLRYAREASERIAAFGGMPVYAGGDDLLFLAPLFGNVDGKEDTLVELCADIHALFSQTVREAFPGRELAFPTLSFGVSVQYEKFPLYEALANGRALLETAKKNSPFLCEEKAVKDNIALRVQKHSGQSFGLLIHNPAHEAFRELSAAAGASSDAINSVLYTVRTFRPLLGILLRESTNGSGQEELERFLSAWGNLFDNPDQSLSRAYAEDIGRVVYWRLLAEESRLSAIDPTADSSREARILDAVCMTLTWVKFLNEKAGEDE